MIEREKLVSLIQNHQQTKKNFAIQDAYKLIYQGVFGIEHIMVDVDQAKKYLEQEFDAIPPSNREPLVENISLAKEIFRLNLRPFKYHNGNVVHLFQAMLKSAEGIFGSPAKFLHLWNEFKQATFDGKLNFNIKELVTFDDMVKQKNYPPVHHSHGYRQANLPAYRVLKKEFMVRNLGVLRSL